SPAPTSGAASLVRADIARRGVRNEDGLSLHVVPYTGLILGAAKDVGVDPAVIAALMETEGSGEMAVSRAGAAGLMQLMPDKLAETDDAFDPATNVLRAAQYIRRLVSAYNGDLASVAGAYFGAIDREGNVTEDSDGNVTGVEYVMIFADAYQRWAAAFNQPTQTIAIRPVIRQIRPTPSPTEAAPVPTLDSRDGPDRDRWYLYIEGPQPAVAPVLF